MSCDTGDDHAVGHMAADVAAAFGGVDILVNSAARPNTGAVVGIEAFDSGEFTEQINVKVLGYLRCARAVAESMKASGWVGSSTSAGSRHGRRVRSPKRA